jgi:hypothetical protein
MEWVEDARNACLDYVKEWQEGVKTAMLPDVMERY